ncbi:glutathione peroxidase [Flavobacterium sp.]|uniref:glutathione peroxidase n=1 Tax=Flavobacterium sp. TaxID=239 RepID=UPI0040489421
MKSIAITTIVFSLFFSTILTTDNSDSMKLKTSIYTIPIKSIEGKKIDLAAFKGKKILIVNTASECGFTKQYADLQKLHEQYKDKLVIIGVPCNQFGGQEPGTLVEIQSFCQVNYGVTFLMTEKVDVKGQNQHPIYKWLTDKELNGVENSSVSWNFEKYLLDENGNYLANFGSMVNPMSDKITKLL